MNHSGRAQVYPDYPECALALLLFGTGVACRIMAPTLIGSAGMIIYVLVVLIALMHGKLAETVWIGIYFTIGGATLFGAGIVLSVYRDRLRALPDRIKRREGIFRIFNWR
jgi:hypothetical protein